MERGEIEVIPGRFSTFFWDRVSPWPGACQYRTQGLLLARRAFYRLSCHLPCPGQSLMVWNWCFRVQRLSSTTYHPGESPSSFFSPLIQHEYVGCDNSYPSQETEITKIKWGKEKQKEFAMSYYHLYSPPSQEKCRLLNRYPEKYFSGFFSLYFQFIIQH